MMIQHLNPREKIIVIGGLVVLTLIFVWFVLLAPYLKTMAKLDRRIASLEGHVAEVGAMRNQILELRQQLSTVGDQKRGNGPLFSQVESLAEQTGVREQLLSMRPQPAIIQGKFRQQLVEIRLEKLPLALLVKLLHAVEYRSGGVQVKSMRVKPRFDDRSVLDIDMVLVSLEKT